METFKIGKIISKIGEENIKDLIKLTENNDYHVAIFCSTVSQVGLISEKIKNLVEYSQCKITKHNPSHYSFRFQNGSDIVVRIPIGNVRGYRFHSIFVDEDVGQKLVDYCLKPYLTKYKR